MGPSVAASWEYLVGDVRDVLAELPEQSVQCIVTSPPYWGLRDYGIPPSIWGEEDWITTHEHEWGEACGTRKEHPDRDHSHSDMLDTRGEQGSKAARGGESSMGNHCQICGAWRGCLGLEPTPELYVDHLVEVCRGLWRVLRDDGTFWLNLGDSYTTSNFTRQGKPRNIPQKEKCWEGEEWTSKRDQNTIATVKRDMPGLKPKDLVMIPERLALALQADGWYVRSRIPWIKRNPMPESCEDRPASAIEYIFELTKSSRYFFDAVAVRRKGIIPAGTKAAKGSSKRKAQKGVNARPPEYKVYSGTRNCRNTDWFFDSIRLIMEGGQGLLLDEDDSPMAMVVNPKPYAKSHFAVFPTLLVRPLILAGTSEKGCCSNCGGPWERIVEKEEGYGKRRCTPGDAGQAVHPDGVGHDLDGPPKATKGYQPTCECPEHEAIPCTVLDPFAGSGTTLKVGRELGRSVIGIDISEEYKKLAMERAMLHTPNIMGYKPLDQEEGDV